MVRRRDGREQPPPRALPARTVFISLDGAGYDVTLTRSEERALRHTLRPYIAASRVVPSAAGAGEASRSQRLSVRMRDARVQALLGLDNGTAAGAEGQHALEDLVERTATIYAQSLADATRATYRRRWIVFTDWCEQHQLQALPADAATVMAYLASHVVADPQPSLSTLRGMVNAINRVHREFDQRTPGEDPALAMLMRGLSRSVPPSRNAEPISALRIEELRAVCRYMDHPNPTVLRDAALIRLHLAGVAEDVLARLRWQDVRFDKKKVVLGERRAKNGPVVSWREVPVLRDTGRCPVAALLRWRSIAGVSPALVFTLVDKDGRRDRRGLGPSKVQAVIESRLDSLGPGRDRTPDSLAKVADLLHEVAADVLRDRAILLLGFAIAGRRGELTRLVWDDVRFVDEGLVLTLRRSKTDLDGRGTTVGVPWGRSVLTCPVRAMSAWQERMLHQLGDGYTGATRVFVKVGRAGRITAAEPLSNEAITMVVKRRMAAAGIEGHWGGRSLRAGLISTAADLDVALELIAKQSRHASLDSLIRYIRNEDVFRRNAVDRVGM
jgi:integrase